MGGRVVSSRLVRVWKGDVHKRRLGAGEDLNCFIRLKPKRRSIKGSGGYSGPTWAHLNSPEDRSSTFWAEAVVKVTICIVREGIFLQFTWRDLDLRILKIDIHAKSRACSCLAVTTMTDSRSGWFAMTFVANGTAATPTCMSFLLIHRSLHLWFGKILLDISEFNIVFGNLVQRPLVEVASSVRSWTTFNWDL